MLKIYKEKQHNTIMVNDSFFNKETCRIVAEDSQRGKMLRSVVEEVDGVKFDTTNLFRIFSKFNGCEISITDISTGCKTLINIMCYPEKVFFGVECGSKVLERIYSLKQGSVYLPFFRVSLDDKFDEVSYCCIDNRGESIVTGMIDLEDWYNE